MAAVALGVIVLVYLAIYFVASLPWAGIFAKAGQSRVAAFVPIWNLVVMLRIIRRRRAWIWLYIGPLAFIVVFGVIVGVVAASLTHLAQSTSVNIAGTISSVPLSARDAVFPAGASFAIVLLVASELVVGPALVAVYVASTVFLFELSKAFGHDIGWTIGLSMPVVSTVFAYMLWLGDSRYLLGEPPAPVVSD